MTANQVHEFENMQTDYETATTFTLDNPAHATFVIEHADDFLLATVARAGEALS